MANGMQRETDWVIDQDSYKQVLDINSTDWALGQPQFILALTGWESDMISNVQWPERSTSLTVERIKGRIQFWQFTLDAGGNRKAMNFRLRVGESDFGSAGAPTAPASYTLAPLSVDVADWANESFLWDHWEVMPFGAAVTGVVAPQILTVDVDVKVRRRLEQPMHLQLVIEGSILAGDTHGRVQVMHSLRTLLSWA